MQQTHTEQGEQWVGNRLAKKLIPEGVHRDKWLEGHGIIAHVGKSPITKSDLRYEPVQIHHLGGCI